MTDHVEAHQPDERQPDERQPDEPQPRENTPLDQQAATLGEHATGDIVIDSALQDLQNAPSDDLDRQLEAGSAVHRTLQGRLSDLGGA